LEYFENNFTANKIKVPILIDPNIGDMVQRESPKILVEQGDEFMSRKPAISLRKSYTPYALSIGTKINDLG